MYAIKIVCKEVKSSDGYLLTREGSTVYLVEDEWGITTRSVIFGAGANLLIWDTAEEADKAAKKLTKKLNPWYIKAKSYEIMEVNPVYNVIGYELKEH